MREKYIEEKFPRYFKFGTSKDGLIDVASTLIDTIVTVPQKQADLLIKDRDNIVNMLITLASKLDEKAPKEFKKLWYEKEE